ncbi:MAG: hypothetical protein J1D86_06460 [Alistipes sp.]|nr:hypothetical protein [Alistipes sp.]
MKRFMKFAAAAFAALLTITACEKSSGEYVEPQLDVTPNNIAGYWRVAVWNGGPLEQSCYVYLNLMRKDRLFELYQNLDSFSPRKVTGYYNITTDEEYGAIIRGNYDHGVGEWSHRYAVSSLTAGSMTWVALDNPDDVTVYERTDAIPEDILAAFAEDEQ